ncbi:proline-rich protein 7 isoform X2 [Dunckerocampus dactyliophorus]|uniref:proline-rich protein 7 isoform X2 n=1 Tax=Dunckerocampus dactyliophorus TaxID=161453 RepID=UPI00240547A4|nr:proline-rich protein 7 isoform X2 [Dunckerocampus dactyliophorus]
MVMSQGTYTFLACFAGFWLVWAFVVMLCCFCSFLQRRLKRRREVRLREQCLRTVETEPLTCPASAYPPPAAPQAAPPPSQQVAPQFSLSPQLPLQVPHPLPEANWVSMPADLFGKPPCYEEAVLMEDPPPPYTDVLSEPRGGTYLKPAPLRAAPLPPREHQDPSPAFPSETSKPPPPSSSVFSERGYSSLIRLPSSQRWDSLGHLLSNMELNQYNLTPPGARSLQAGAAMATMPRQENRTGDLRGRMQGLHHRDFQGGVQRLRGLESSCGLPTAFPLLGRSTAV